MVSMTIKSSNQLKLLNLVTMATTTNCIKALFDANKEGSKENTGLGEITVENYGFHCKQIIESA